MKSNSTDALKRADLNGFRRGVKAAADIANQYDGSSLHPFRLGDCIEAKLNMTRRAPRRNNSTEAVLAGARQKLFELKITDERILQMAMAMNPEYWAYYVKNKGHVENMVFWECLESIVIAKRLFIAGFRDCAPSRPPLQKFLKSSRLSSVKRRKTDKASRPRRKVVS